MSDQSTNKGSAEKKGFSLDSNTVDKIGDNLREAFDKFGGGAAQPAQDGPKK